jgi:hypothetical protein
MLLLRLLAPALVLLSCSAAGGPGAGSGGPPGADSAPDAAAASPATRYRPGVSYYSDDFALAGQVYRLVGEKNLEEVYQSYRYYEAVHDGEQRVVTFREYLRGERAWTEAYLYTPEGRLLEKRRTEPGEAPQVIRYRD